jgi:hypothetical protein
MRRAADVVHQHVKAAEAGQHLPGEGVVAADAGVVGGQEMHTVVAGAAPQRHHRGITPLRVAAGDKHLGAICGQGRGGRQSDPRRPAGDQDRRLFHHIPSLNPWLQSMHHLGWDHRPHRPPGGLPPTTGGAPAADRLPRQWYETTRGLPLGAQPDSRPLADDVVWLTRR